MADFVELAARGSDVEQRIGPQWTLGRLRSKFAANGDFGRVTLNFIDITVFICRRLPPMSMFIVVFP